MKRLNWFHVLGFSLSLTALGLTELGLTGPDRAVAQDEFAGIPSESEETAAATAARSSESCGKVTYTQLGIGSVRDSRQRDPRLVVSTDCLNGSYDNGVKILASVSNENESYLPEKFPYLVKFYVNGKLIEEQYLSKALPRDLGVDVLPEVAKVPFNFAVSAQVQAPNEQYTSIVEAAALGRDFETLSCVLRTSSESFEIQDAAVEQSSGTEVLVRLNGTSIGEDDGDEIEGTFKAAISGEEITGTLTLLDDGEVDETLQLTGTVSTDGNGKVTGLDFSSEEDATSLKCE